MPGTQNEGTIAIDPTNPSHLFAAANTQARAGVMIAFSNHGGMSWRSRVIADGSDGLLESVGDPRAAFDQFGNLFFAYLSTPATGREVVLLAIRDDGQSLDVVHRFAGAAFDQPRPNGTRMNADQHGDGKTNDNKKIELIL